MSYGKRLRHYRELRGWTQDDLAHHAGLTTMAISRMETAARKVTLDEGVKLAKALHITLAELAGIEQEPSQQTLLEEWKASVLQELEQVRSRIEKNDLQHAMV